MAIICTNYNDSNLSRWTSELPNTVLIVARDDGMNSLLENCWCDENGSSLSWKKAEVLRVTEREWCGMEWIHLAQDRDL
jgi:hypothetical protein